MQVCWSGPGPAGPASARHAGASIGTVASLKPASCKMMPELEPVPVPLVLPVFDALAPLDPERELDPVPVPVPVPVLPALLLQTPAASSIVSSSAQTDPLPAAAICSQADCRAPGDIAEQHARSETHAAGGPLLLLQSPVDW